MVILHVVAPMEFGGLERVNENGFVIGWAGRLSGDKGPDVLLEARVHLTDLPITASVVGDGRERRARACPLTSPWLRAERCGTSACC
jgi:glycosyltransferase involved in cell wall biosynthesis